MPELSVVIPASNEAAHLRASLFDVIKAVGTVTKDFELIVVDDGSRDGTWAQIAEVQRECPRLRALRLARNYGKEAAVAAGLEHSAGAAALILDADLQHPLDRIAEFYRLWKEGAEVVHGVKSGRASEPLHRRVLASLFNASANRLTGMRFDRAADFKLLDRKVIDAWLRMPERRIFFRGMVAWLGFRTAEVPFTVQPRAGGRSRYGFGSLLLLGWKAISAYSYLPLRIIHLFAAGFLIFSILLGAWALYLKAAGEAVSGFTTVIVLELMIGGCILLSLALIAEYLAAIYEETKQRPRYVVTERLGD